ncbi:HK97 gp10 family phage protein [Anoxybacteroides rupiense]|uniref:HK97 gp10 family phage protein n=1 Tax=Anoxybacteroides rupiense TaxID=311460 RepID=UPI00367085B4
MAKIKIGRLTDEITSQLRKYSQVIADDVEQIMDDVTKEAVGRIKSKIQEVGLVQTGDYMRGWARKRVPNGWVIHNKTEYRLAHLLEYGHATVDGRRIQGTPHIRPVEDWLEKEFEDRVEKAIKNET